MSLGTSEPHDREIANVKLCFCNDHITRGETQAEAVSRWGDELQYLQYTAVRDLPLLGSSIYVHEHSYSRLFQTPQSGLHIFIIWYHSSSP